jgi:hypothetical protein
MYILDQLQTEHHIVTKKSIRLWQSNVNILIRCDISDITIPSQSMRIMNYKYYLKRQSSRYQTLLCVQYPFDKEIEIEIDIAMIHAEIRIEDSISFISEVRWN